LQKRSRRADTNYIVWLGWQKSGMGIDKINKSKGSMSVANKKNTEEEARATKDEGKDGVRRGERESERATVDGIVRGKEEVSKGRGLIIK
jgi:hypothetical protein